MFHFDRDVARVVEDVKDEIVSIAAARSTYGVVFAESDRRTLRFAVDEGATAKRRQEMRRDRART